MSTKDTVIITGTTSGLGRAIAIRLASNGYRIVGIARRSVSAEELGTSKESYTHINFDLRNIDGISKMVTSLVKVHGYPYALINNAALGLDGILPTMHNTDIAKLIEVNLLSPIILTKYLIRPMLVQRRGRIVNISSIVAESGYRGLSVYAATKAGIQGFTHSLARDVGARNVTVNCIAPGFMDTEMTASLADENLERIRRRSPLERFPSELQVAATVEFLLSDAGDGITGTTLTVDAGNSA